MVYNDHVTKSDQSDFISLADFNLLEPLNKNNMLVPLKRNQCVSKECKYYRRFDFIKGMKIYDAKLFTCHRASSKHCQLSPTQNLF